MGPTQSVQNSNCLSSDISFTVSFFVALALVSLPFPSYFIIPHKFSQRQPIYIVPTSNALESAEDSYVLQLSPTVSREFEKDPVDTIRHVIKAVHNGQKFINQYVSLKMIGRGSFAKVFGCLNFRTHERFVCFISFS